MGAMSRLRCENTAAIASADGTSGFPALLPEVQT